MKNIKIILGSIFLIALITFNIQNFKSKTSVNSLASVISTALADGEGGGGGTYTCYYYFDPLGSLPNLICYNEFICYYRYQGFVYYPEECYDPQWIPV